MRKTFLIITLGWFLAACGSTTSAPVVGTVSPVQIRVVSWDHGTGEFRLAFALLDGPESAEGVTAVSLEIFPIDGDTETAVWSGTATGYTDYEIPYWTAYPTIAEAGFWGVVATVQQNDETVTSDFVIEVVPEAGSPAIGESVPPSQNRTIATEPDLELLSSGNNPNPAFYQLTVAEAVANEKPTVVGFLTPGLCQTRWCAPVLDSVASVRDQIGEEANYIHIEVFSDFQELTYVPEMAEWGLGTMEPWVFVLNSDGEVAAKFSGPLSPQELEAALRPFVEN